MFTTTVLLSDASLVVRISCFLLVACKLAVSLLVCCFFQTAPHILSKIAA